MGSLGASAAIVCITAAWVNFSVMRSVPSPDTSLLVPEKYWAIAFAGYVITLIAVPAMALVGNWRLAAAPILAELIGRALRKPTVSAMLCYTTGKLGRGWDGSMP
jgi:hypothetical protein